MADGPETPEEPVLLVEALESPVERRARFKQDPRNRLEAIRIEMAAAMASFRYFVTVTMGYDGTRGLSPYQREAGMRASGADGTDFTDPAYDPVWPWFEKARTKSSLLMLPRFTGKTTLIALWCLWLGLKNPDIRIGIVGYKFELASEILTMVRRWMVSDTKGDLRKVFGTFGKLPPLGSKWGRDDFLDFPGRTAVHRDHTISAIGMSEATEGGHFEIIILEDLVNKVSSQTRAGVDEVKKFVRQSSGLGMTIADDYGNIIGRAPKIMVGTPWDGEDAYMDAIAGVKQELAEGKEATWNILRLQARIPRQVAVPVEMPGGSFTTALKEEYDQDCTARFRHLPDRVLKEYRYAKDGFGAVDYAAQMDLDPIPLENRMLKREWFENHFYEDDEVYDVGTDGTRKFKPTFVTAGFADLAGSSGESRDRTAHGAFANDPRGHLYLLDECAGRFAVQEEGRSFTPTGNLNIMAEWTLKYGLWFTGVEGGVLRTVYDAEVKRWNRTHPDRPIRLKKVASGGARGNLTNDRALAIAAMAERGEIHLKRSQADFLEELLRYTPSKDNTRDDRVAMLALACLNKLGWGRAPEPEPEPKKTMLQEMDERCMAEIRMLNEDEETFSYE